MKMHTFIEFENGKYQTLKKFLHFDGSVVEVPEKNKECDALYKIHHVVLLTNEGCAKELLRKYILKLNYKCIEGYPKPHDLKFADINTIKSVQDLESTNQGFHGFMSNYLFAFVYPEKFRNYDFYKIDYFYSRKQAYNKEIDYTIDDKRDEMIFSINENIKSQLRYN